MNTHINFLRNKLTDSFITLSIISVLSVLLILILQLTGKLNWRYVWQITRRLRVSDSTTLDHNRSLTKLRLGHDYWGLLMLKHNEWVFSISVWKIQRILIQRASGFDFYMRRQCRWVSRCMAADSLEFQVKMRVKSWLSHIHNVISVRESR